MDAELPAPQDRVSHVEGQHQKGHREIGHRQRNYEEVLDDAQRLVGEHTQNHQDVPDDGQHDNDRENQGGEKGLVKIEKKLGRALNQHK